MGHPVERSALDHTRLRRNSLVLKKLILTKTTAILCLKVTVSTARLAVVTIEDPTAVTIRMIKQNVT